MNLDYSYKTLDLSSSDIHECAGLLTRSFHKSAHFNTNFLNWEYNENPMGKAVGFNAYHEGALVGHYSTIPMTACVFGQKEKGLLSINTATHPLHQGHGLFTQLANKTYDYAANLGYSFVVGVSNQNSTHGFTKKLGFQYVGSLSAKIGYGFPYSKEIIQNKNIEFTRLWDNACLQWRINNPLIKYNIFSVKNMSVLMTKTKFMGIHAILGCFPQDFTFEITKNNANFHKLKLWIGIDPNLHWGGTFYYSIPSWLKPSPLNLIFKDLTAQKRKLDINRVRFQLLDFDVF